MESRQALLAIDHMRCRSPAVPHVSHHDGPKKDRTTILPRNRRDELQAQIEAVKALHHQDLEEGFGEVYIPAALARKYPKAARETGWHWVFPARARSLDPRSGREMVITGANPACKKR